MKTIRPSGRVLVYHHCILRPHTPTPRLLPLLLQSRSYAQKQKQQPAVRSTPRQHAPPIPAWLRPSSTPHAVDSALQTVQGKAPLDPINAPLSTLPPPISIPTRDGNDSIFAYLWNLARAYTGFYRSGVKAVYYNYKAAKLLKSRLLSTHVIEDVTLAVQNGLLTRSEFQILERNQRDIGKVPFFAVLVLLLGEWLPLFVPFMPGVVPGTCRIPKQVMGMREKAEERRKASFRSGVPEPAVEEGKVHDGISWPMAFDHQYRKMFLQTLRPEQLLHISSTLNLHGNFWTLLQLPPPSFLLRGRIQRRLAYLARDDKLLLAARTNSIEVMSFDELNIACEERGMDILGRSESMLREGLSAWLWIQARDEGEGRYLQRLLFRRPNVWGGIGKEP